MKPTIRPETKNDYVKITEINDRAFGQNTEGKIIEKLRDTKKFIPELSLVAELNNEIIGHILFYPITINAGLSKFSSLALGPMSVIPRYQRRGVGGQLVVEGLRLAKKLGHKSVIVIGHSEYYPKFGFKPASQWNIRPPFEVPDNVFLALELAKNELTGKSGTVEYPKEYCDV